MQFSLDVIATRPTASLQANAKQKKFTNTKIQLHTYSYLLLPKNINTDGVSRLGCSVSGKHPKNK